MKNILFVKFSNERNRKFKIKTEICEENGKRFVVKSPADSEAKTHILSMHNNYAKLVESYQSDRVEINKGSLSGDSMCFEYVDGECLDAVVDRLLFEERNIQGAMEEILAYLNEISKAKLCPNPKLGEEFKLIFGETNGIEDYECTEFSNIDAVLSNVILKDGKYTLVDYEWAFDFPVPLKYIQYRVVINYILDKPIRGIVADNGIFDRLGLSQKDRELFDRMEKHFQHYVYGESLNMRSYYSTLDLGNFNMVEAADRMEADRFKNIVDIFFDYGEGVVPESVISRRDVIKNEHGCVEVELDGNTPLRAVRIDPLTDCCMLFNVSIEVFNDDGVSIPEFGTNGHKLADDCFVFSDPDAQFYIAVDKNTKKVRMTYDIERLTEDTAKSLIENDEKLKGNIDSLKDEILDRDSTIADQRAEIGRKEDVIAEKSAELERAAKKEERLNSLVAEREGQIESLNTAIARKDSQIEGLNGVIMSRERQIEEIYNSTCWKITAPLRYVVTGTKKFFRNNSLTSKGYEFLFYVKKLGYKGAVEHYRRLNAPSQPVDVPKADIISKDDIKPLENLDKSIAVHLHLFYEDLADEFFAYFNNIPFKFDLFVSCREDADADKIRNLFKKLRCVNRVEVRPAINRGRDIAPLYVLFGREIEKYDYFMHVHSKKSVYSGKEQYGWRQFSMDCLLKDETTVRKIFALFESRKIGLFYPETFGEMPMIAQDWLENAAGGRAFLESLGIKFDDGFFNYPVGSFFWARTDALRPVFDKHLKYEDFPEEAGQTDGTLAHVLERAISFVSNSRGYADAIHDIRSGFISLGRSYKVYEPYFSISVDDAKTYLSGFDVISFDIFDTLITRAVYMPDDVFRLMETRLKKEYGIDCDYLALRKRAEALAWNKKGAYTNIDDIYECLPSVMNISAEEAMQFKQMEIDLEMALCLPRRDMLEIFNYLKSCGKKIVLISDMYLTREIISRMLAKCGYEGYSDIWISCERGTRKDGNTIWNDFYDIYSTVKTVHVGDNPHSDIQTVIDRHKESFFVINPRTAFKMSRYYTDFEPYINGSLTERILLGMFVNAGIYNSPFCQKLNGEPDISRYADMGYSAFGPLFTVFSLWLNTVTEKDNVLMFLAREGYIFERLYNNVFEHNPDKKRRSVYFLSSRRAASVAAIRNEEDIRSILAQYYRGSLSNLLKSRLGIEIYPDIADRDVAMADDLDSVMDSLKPHFDDIYARAEKERSAYKKYIEELGIEDEGVVVDVGYSGTIQFYLAKLRENKQAGAYLCTSTNRKPEQLGCSCLSLYPIFDISEEKTNKIFRNQLFLEAVLKAPFGQLICFNEEGGEVKPMYKDDSVIPDNLNELQQGMLSFAKDFGDVACSFMDSMEVSSSLAADMFDICLKGDWMSDKVAEIMTVQDDYCENGSHRFNPHKGVWEIIKQ